MADSAFSEGAPSSALLRDAATPASVTVQPQWVSRPVERVWRLRNLDRYAKFCRMKTTPAPFRLGIVSDLHLEADPHFKLDASELDVLVAVGDILSGDQEVTGVEYLAQAAPDIPVLYVSHSPDEVARLADHVVLLEQGRAIAQGELRETLARLDLPTAFSEDAGVVVEAEVAGHDAHYHLTRLTFPGGEVLVSQRPEAPGQRLRFRVHARDVSLALQRAEGSSITNLLPARVAAVVAADTPAHVLVRLDAGGTPLLARITRRSADQLAVTPGQQLWAQIKTVALLG